jgi:molybdopterin converting factor small subunit
MVIRFFASFRPIVGEKGIAWEPSTPTLAELLRLLLERYETGFRRRVLAGDELWGGVLRNRLRSCRGGPRED